MDKSGFKLSESAASCNKRRWELPVTCGLAWWVKVTSRLHTWTCSGIESLGPSWQILHECEEDEWMGEAIERWHTVISKSHKVTHNSRIISNNSYSIFISLILTITEKECRGPFGNFHSFSEQPIVFQFMSEGSFSILLYTSLLYDSCTVFLKYLMFSSGDWRPQKILQLAPPEWSSVDYVVFSLSICTVEDILFNFLFLFNFTDDHTDDDLHWYFLRYWKKCFKNAHTSKIKLEGCLKCKQNW